ncbi:MAG: NlpC/P60 family protein [Candidatus Avilachnospira sp.]|jgi:cell wall-associated NlpC family hydrolase
MRKNINRKQIIIISLIALTLTVTAVGLDVCLDNGLFASENEGIKENAATSSMAPKSTGYIYSEKIGSKLTEIEDEPYVEGPDTLNLAYYYPEGADTSDVMNSFAGLMYTDLAVKDADYFSDIYDMGDRLPLQLARELGYDSSKVMGKYNPTVSSQDPDNPATWAVNRFKNVNVAFYDGDGNRINGYSNVKEILSMASVYSYYHDMTDADAMKAYAEQLWQHSHSYKVSIGNVYYCSGCLNKSIQDEAREAIEQERRQQELEASLAQNTAASSGNAVVIPGSTEAPVDFTIEELDGGTEAPKVLYAPEPTEESSASPVNEESSSEAELTQSTVIETETSAPSSAPTMESTTTVAATQPTPTIELQSAASGAQGLSYRGIPLTGLLDISIENIENEASEGAPQETAAVEPSVNTIISPGVNMGATDQSTQTESGNSQALPSASEETSSQTGENLSSAAEIVGSCPGHVDLYITVTLYGIDDYNGLAKVDTVGNDPANFNDKWQGWTDEALEMARKLNSADWFKRYGLTISAINVRNPLSESEINAYIERMPQDISQQRKDIVNFALHSVGKVPYYWGGKPSDSGYEANSFGMLMSPDTRGRVLRGLDCSGWINWVYWSVLGNPLPGESTGTLIGCGERIQRSELRPGDIMVRIGADAHVVMFIEWAENGNMVVVHETGGAINNVTVSEMSADWPYYRKLIP